MKFHDNVDVSHHEISWWCQCQHITWCQDVAKNGTEAKSLSCKTKPRIAGTSLDLCSLVSVLWDLVFELRARVFIDRVATDANPSDMPSRGDVRTGEAVGWRTVKAVWPRALLGNRPWSISEKNWAWELSWLFRKGGIHPLSFGLRSFDSSPVWVVISPLQISVYQLLCPSFHWFQTLSVDVSLINGCLFNSV